MHCLASLLMKTTATLFWSSHGKDLALIAVPALPASALAASTLILIKKMGLECHFEHRPCKCPVCLITSTLPRMIFDLYQLLVSREYLCTVWGIAHARWIPKRQLGQGCKWIGSLCVAQSSSFILPGLCILNTLLYALTPHWHVLSCVTQNRTKTLPCWVAAQPSWYFRHSEKKKKRAQMLRCLMGFHFKVQYLHR